MLTEKWTLQDTTLAQEVFRRKTYTIFFEKGTFPVPGSYPLDFATGTLFGFIRTISVTPVRGVASEAASGHT